MHACTPQGASSPVGALVFGGTNVIAAGVNRAATHECFAQCPQGTTCNHESGFCESLGCSSRCPADLVCERVGHDDVCVTPRRERDLSVDASAD